jgi:hypothetical protein
MDEVTQQNAALVEEAAAAAEAMQEQAEVLMNAVSVFRLNSGSASTRQIGSRISPAAIEIRRSKSDSGQMIAANDRERLRAQREAILLSL